MNDFMNFLKTPEGIGLLSAGFGGLAHAKKNQPINTIGAAGVTGLLGYNNAQNAQVMRDWRDMQVQSAQAQQMAKQRQQDAIAAMGPEVQAAVAAGVPYQEIWKRQNPEQKYQTVGNTLVEVGPSGVKPAYTAPEKLQEWQTMGPDGKPIINPQYLDLKKQIAAAGRSSVNVNTPVNTYKNESDLRKEFEGLDPVKNYRLAYPAYSAVKDAASRNTPQADINLVYGIAKLYDPASVVREGEYNTIANSQAIPQRIIGMAKNLAGGGKLTAETKAQLIQEAEGRLAALEGEYSKTHGTYKGIVERNQFNPQNIFSPIGRVGIDGQTQPGTNDIQSAAAAELKRRGIK